jgi:hypothetical protein
MGPESFEWVAEKVRRAIAPEDLFGSLTGSREQQKQAVLNTTAHHERVLSPSKYPNEAEKRILADQLCSKLEHIKEQAILKIEQDLYGNRSARVRPSEPPPSRGPASDREFGEKLFEGDACNFYLQPPAPSGPRVVLKVPKDATKNKLVENEVTILEKLRAKEQGKPPKFTSLILHPMYTGARGSVFTAFPLLSEYLPLEKILALQHSNVGIKDVLWIWRRTLAILGFAHRCGYLHGAVLPPHIMIQPMTHSLKLIGWGHAVTNGTSIDDIEKKYEDVYAPEVLEGQPAGRTSDLYSLAQSMRLLLQKTPGQYEQYPAYYRKLLELCLLDSPTKRPISAWKLYVDTGKPGEK